MRARPITADTKPLTKKCRCNAGSMTTPRQAEALREDVMMVNVKDEVTALMVRIGVL